MLNCQRVYWILVLITVLLAAGAAGTVFAGEPVAFSGVVKKVRIDANKVAIKDTVNKKRFTVVVNDTSKLEGFAAIGELKKGDAVSGHYVVTDKGLYVVTEMKRGR